MVKSRDGDSRGFRVTRETRIERNRKPATLADCRPGDRIVVRFDPDDEGRPRVARVLLVRGK